MVRRVTPAFLARSVTPIPLACSSRTLSRSTSVTICRRDNSQSRMSATMSRLCCAMCAFVISCMTLWYRLKVSILVNVGCVWFTVAMKKRATYVRRKLMMIEVREFWLLLGAATFFASACVVLCIFIAYLVKG